VHVPYRGSAPALIDMLAGQVQVMIDPLPASIEHVRSGRLRPLAVTTATRFPALPDVPTATEFVPGYLADSWHGAGVPRNTPGEIVDTLNHEINAGLADPRIKARITELGASVLTGSPSDFAKLLSDETEKWGKVVKVSGAKPE
jgi:tripartite-type tricarboxylate transporter receptor subunit TctC